jgi:hypothetical protein
VNCGCQETTLNVGSTRCDEVSWLENRETGSTKDLGPLMVTVSMAMGISRPSLHLIPPGPRPTLPEPGNYLSLRRIHRDERNPHPIPSISITLPATSNLETMARTRQFDGSLSADVRHHHSAQGGTRRPGTLAAPTAVVLENVEAVERGTEAQAHPPGRSQVGQGEHGHDSKRDSSGVGSVTGTGTGTGTVTGTGTAPAIRANDYGRHHDLHHGRPRHSNQARTHDVDKIANHLANHADANVDNDHDEDEDEDGEAADGDGDDDGDESCFICAEKVKYYSGGVCGHKTCQ